MDGRDILLDAFSLIRSLDVAEIKSRIQWLEASLEAYRTVLELKQLQDSAPLEMPAFKSLYVPLTDIAKADAGKPVTRMKGEMKQLVVNYLMGQEEPRSSKQIAEAIGAITASVHNHLIFKQGLLYKMTKHPESNTYLWELLKHVKQPKPQPIQFEPRDQDHQ